MAVTMRSWLSPLAAVLAISLLGCGDPPGDDADDSAIDDPGPKPTFDGEVTPAPPLTRRLTTAQYRNALIDLFGDGIALPSQLEPDLEVEDFFAVGAAVSTLSPRGAELYEQAAYDVAVQVLGDEDWRAANLPCTPSGAADTACFADILEPLARRAWRRPITVDERDTMTGLSADAAEVLGDVWEGLAFGLAFVLQSPDFLYRLEEGEERDDGLRWYSGPEMAERLSFLLWNRLPDEALLEAAEDGTLDTPEGIREQAERLLDDPRARGGVLEFFEDLYNLDKARRLRKDPDVFPQVSATLGESARTQTRLDLEHLVFDLDGDFRTLLDKTWTHLDRELAALYRVPAPTLDGFGKAELDADGARAGLLGHASILATEAHPTSSSATRRGIFVRTKLLCQVIPSPPADVNTAIPEATETLPTLRDRVARHLEDPACAGCHRLMDPIGLGLEPYDGIGAVRTRENGVAIDASGELDGEAFDGPADLADILASHPNLGACLAEKLYTYAQGRPPEVGEEDELAWLSEAFAWEGHRVRALLLDLVSSDAFRRTAAPDPTPPPGVDTDEEG